MKKLGNWLRIILSVGLLVYLITRVDLQEMANLIAQSNKWLILLAVGMGILDRILMTYKWNLLLKAKGIFLSLGNALSIYWKTTFLGQFLPATVGADALRAYALSRENYPLDKVASSIIIERLLGFVALFIMVIVSVLLSITILGENFFDGMSNLFWVFSVFLIVAIAGLYITMRQDVLRFFGDFAQKRGGKLTNNKIAKKLGQIIQAYSSYRDQPGTLLYFLFLSVVENLLPVVWTYFLSVAFGMDVSLLYFFIIVPIVLVLIRIPISLSGFGVREGSFVYFLGLIGVGTSQAFLLGFSVQMLTLVIFLPGGILYAMQGMALPKPSPTSP